MEAAINFSYVGEKGYFVTKKTLVLIEAALIVLTVNGIKKNAVLNKKRLWISTIYLFKFRIDIWVENTRGFNIRTSI